METLNKSLRKIFSDVKEQLASAHDRSMKQYDKGVSGKKTIYRTWEFILLTVPSSTNKTTHTSSLQTIHREIAQNLLLRDRPIAQSVDCAIPIVARSIDGCAIDQLMRNQWIHRWRSAFDGLRKSINRA